MKYTDCCKHRYDRRRVVEKQLLQVLTLTGYSMVIYQHYPETCKIQEGFLPRFDTYLKRLEVSWMELVRREEPSALFVLREVSVVVIDKDRLHLHCVLQLQQRDSFFFIVKWQGHLTFLKGSHGSTTSAGYPIEF